MAADAIFEQTMKQIGEQHARWVDAATSASMKALRDENRRLEVEVTALRSFFLVKAGGQRAPPLPKLPGELYGPEAPALDAQALLAAPRPSTPTTTSSFGGGTPWATEEVAIDQAPRRRGATVRQRCAEGVSLPGMVDVVAWEAPQPGDVPPARHLVRKSTARGLSSEAIERKLESKHRRRVQAMFGLSADAEVVPQDILTKVIRDRMDCRRPVCDAWIVGVLAAMDAAREGVAKAKPEFRTEWMTDAGFALDGLLQLLSSDASSFVQQVPLGKQKDVWEMASALDILTVDEVIDEAARGTNFVPAPESASRMEKMGSTVNAIVVAVVLSNVFALGMSVDHSPEHIGWLAVEALCVAVFVGEAIFKLVALGSKGYFCGEARVWNILDLFVTIMSVLELMFTVVSHAMVDSSDSLSKLSHMARPIVMLRTIRIIRVVRLAKLLYTPMLRDLANMLVGFVIGAPPLVWVLVVFCFVLYLLALVFRLMLGPSPGQDLMVAGGCGWADDITDYDDQVCKIHYMYGEEFFGSLPASMFTIFRFMLGDYSTRGGKSMIIAFSAGYGARFDTVFVTFMIVVIFGLFNIITAIFVDSTTAGLKHNDVKRKYAQQYERRYVKRKLRSVMSRIREMLEDSPAGSHQGNVDDVEGLELERHSFVKVMEDPVIRETIGDLDIDISNPGSMFDTFDANGDGTVTMLEFMRVLMKLRGEPGKTDIIECVVSIRNLQAKFEQLALTLQVSHEAGAASGVTSRPVSRVLSRQGSGSFA